MHSWRLLILPYLDCSATYSQYNFKEPWNAPSNSAVLSNHKYGYKCPADQAAYQPDSNATSYVAIVGTTSWRRGNDRNRESHDRKSEASDTFLVVEMG